MAKKKKTSYEQWAKQNNSAWANTKDVVVTSGRAMREVFRESAQNARNAQYSTPGFNPYQDYNTALRYGQDLKRLNDSLKGQNLFVNSVRNGSVNPLGAYRQQNAIQSALRNYNDMMSQVNGEADFNEKYAYPLKYQGLQNAAGVTARLQGMQRNIAALRQSGDKKKADALQAEYDWLNQRQYDYWKPEDFDAKVKELTGLADQARANSRTHGNYTQTSTGLQRQTSPRTIYDLPSGAELREQGDLDTERQLRGQVSMLQAAKERNAYRDTMKGWSEQDFKLMSSLASYTRDTQFGGEGESDPTASQKENIRAHFRRMGYSDEQIDSLVQYTIRQEDAVYRQQQLESVTEWAKNNPVLSSFASIPTSIVSGIGYLDLLRQASIGKTDAFTGDAMRLNQYSAATAGSDVSSAIRSAVGEKINSPVGNLVYQAAMSFADSFVAMQSGAWVGEAMLGLSAATAATRSAYQRGATDGQALISGGMAGLAESLFEHFSLDNLRVMRTGNAAARRTITEAALDTLKQMGIEASEEGATDIANLISDAIIMGDKSELNVNIQKYRDQGMSQADATVQAWKEWGSQLFEDMAAGALSGGMGSVVNTGIGTIQRNAGYVSEGRKILDAGNASALKDLGAALQEGSYGRGLAENVNADGTNRKTARQLGAIASELNQNTLRQGVQSRLEQLGVTNASETATAILRELNEQTTTKAQDQLLKSKAAQRVLTEFRSAAEGSTSYTNEWAYDALYENAERGRTLRTSDETVKEVAEFAKDYGRHEEAVNKLFKLQSDMPVDSFKTGFDAAYTMGKNGVDMEQAMTATATQRMSETQRALAWEIGRSAANTTTTNNEEGAEINGEEGSVSLSGIGERYDGARAEESVGELAEGAEPAARNGQVLSRSAKDSGAADLSYEVEPVSTADLGIAGGTKNKSLYRVSENQKLTPAVQVAVDTAKANGRNIVLFGGGNLEVRDGDAIASVRGLYDPNTNTMYVRVDHKKYTAEQIAKHENGHGLIEEGKITVKEVQDYMKRTMDEEAVDQALADYADAYDGIQMTDDELWHEIICDALGSMNIFDGITGFSEYAERAEQRGEAIRNAAAEMQKGRAPPADNGVQKFSMETPIEETNKLIAWHNMGVDALNGALEIGGLAMPSWAIQPANKSHTQYGDVSVIAPRDLIDPKRNKNSMIFGGDAWTPVFPEINYKVSYEAAEALEDEIKALVGEDVYRQIGGAALDKDNIADQFKRSNGRLSGHYARNLLLQYAYLKSTGSDIEAPTKEDNLYYGGDFTNEDVRRFVGKLTNGKRTLEKLENMSVDELFEQDDLLQTIADLRRDSYREKLKGKKELLEKFEKSNLFSKDDIKFSTIDRMLKAARKYLDGGVQQTVDKKALQEIIDREVDQSAYEAWILQKLSATVERKGIRNEKDIFTPAGNRRSFDQLNYAYTLANIVKAMKAQPKQGRAQFLSGPGSVRGAAMKSYKDVEQARSEIGRVFNYEEDSDVVDAAFDEYNENLSDILDRMTKNGDKFDAANTVIEILQHAKTEQGIYNYMQRELKDWYNVSPELAHNIYELIGQVNALPIPYFEGKTYDAVRLDEALAIVVPDTINADLKKRLEDAGANVLEYKANDDADRLRVVNSVEGAKFSRDLENLDELRRENDRLRKRLDEAKQQTKRTTEPTLRNGDVRKAARGLLKEMDSTLTVDDVADDMKALGEYMMRGEGKNERAPSWEEVKRRASEIAERIVDNASALSEASDVELYKELRNYLRTTKLTLSEADRADMQDGYAEFVKRNFNRIKLGNDGLPVDSAYQELQEMYGEGLFPAVITHPADQLMHIEDVLNGLRPVYENPHSFHRQEAVAWAANAVIDTLLSEDVRQTAPTFADKAEARREKDVAEAVAWERYKGEQREDRLKERYAKRMKDALQKAKERRARDIDRLVLKQKFKESARKERSARTALWNKILDLKKDFRRMVEKPQQADSKHAPLRLARALDGVTNCFSVENRERILPISELDRALGKLRDVYKLAEKDDELALYYDEGLIDNIDAVRTMLNEVDPFDATLDSQKLQKVYDLLKMCKHNVTTANQFVSRNWAKTIIEAGRKWAAEIASASIIFKKGFAAQLLNYQLRPDSMFARFSGFAKNSVGEQIQEMLVDGEEKMLRIQQNFYYAFERFSKSKEFDKLTRHGKASLVDVGLKDENGNAIKLTRDQMLALYMNLRSEDNILALAYGGADIPSVSTYYTGKVAKSFDDSVRTVSIDANVFKLIDEARNLADEAQGENVTDERRQEVQQRLDELQSEVKALEQEAFTNLFGVKARIEKQLTKFEKDLVEAADEWMLKSKDYINAETKAMYGIEKAQVEHYWPIHRNMNFVNTDMRTAVNEINLENWGSLKERVKSHAPIKLTGFIFELDNHTKKMSQFCGFAAAQRDFNKLYQTRMPYQHSTLKEQIAKKFGSDSGLIGVSGMEYIDNYIAAVSGGGDATKPSVLAWARRNLPRATLSANFRVALSQVASVPTAAAEVGWGAMAKGFARYSLKGFSGKQIEALAKADPWFWQRSRGDGGMREFAEMKESTFALDRGYNKIAGTKVGKALLNWCQKFDMYATYTQWAMAEEWVKQNRKDLKKGSEAFDEAVSRKYRDILRRTQPNYTVTERSDLLRDKRESMKWATMYKTQSNQNLNILYDATAQLRQYTRDFKNGKNGVTQQDVADARRQFARAYSGVILGGTVTFVLFRAFANALIHAMNAYRDDDDKELTLESFLEGLGEETLGAISGMFLLGSEIEEFIFAAVTHGKYWGLSDSAISAISDVVKNLYNLTQDPSKEQILKFVNSLAAPLGLPISNVKKIVDGIGYHIEDIRNGEFLSFDAGVNRTAQQQASRFAKAMEDGDTAKMKRIYDEMVATSKAKDPEANTQKALREQIKEMFVSSDGKLSESEALRLLEKFGGKTGDEAKNILNKWKFEKEFGYEYDELGDRYIAGELSDSEYKNALMNYGGKSEEDADEIVGKNKLVREYGFEYSEDNIVDAAIAGDITTEEAFDIWTNYGGVNEREAENRATRLQFVVDNPGIAYDDAKIGMVTDYDEYVAAANGANIKPFSAEDFSEYWLAADALSSDYDANGNPIKGSERKDKVFAYIASLNIPAEQKTAIALSMYAAKTVSKMKTW